MYRTEQLGRTFAVVEGLNSIPDTLPDDLVTEFGSDLVSR